MPFFFVFSLVAILPTIADNRTDYWYQIAYEYSQKAQNTKALSVLLVE